MTRILYHVGFWLAFTLLFVYQNTDAELNDYLTWFWFLFVSAIVTYINLLFLLPRFYFRKKYLLYVVFLLALLGVGSLSFRIVNLSENEVLRHNYFQDFINLLFFVIITSSLKFFREFQQKQARLIKVENERLKTELKLLKAQVNPHFLFNTLSNLYGLILQEKNEQAAEITLKLSDLMRYLLESSNSDKVKLSQEVKFIEDYLSLEKIRLSQNADIQFKVSGLSGGEEIAPLLFIPFVENAFKHGLQSLSQDCYAHFTLAKQGDELYFEARNSLGKHLNPISSGTGLVNLKKRLNLNYPNSHILEIDKDSSQYKAVLQITL